MIAFSSAVHRSDCYVYILLNLLLPSQITSNLGCISKQIQKLKGIAPSQIAFLGGLLLQSQFCLVIRNIGKRYEGWRRLDQSLLEQHKADKQRQLQPEGGRSVSTTRGSDNDNNSILNRSQCMELLPCSQARSDRSLT